MARSLIKTRDEIAGIRESCRIVGEVLRLIGGMIRPGVATRSLDALAEEFIRAQGGEPAFKGYGRDKRNLFPASLCTSVNDEVVHGIPGDRMLEEGDIISIDVGVRKDGLFGDGAWTFAVEPISDEKRRLMKVTEESLHRGIDRARMNNRVHDISAVIQAHVEAAGFSVVRDLVGHGIGRELHEEPAIPNFGIAGTGAILKAGMTLAIEPMVNAGVYQVTVDGDGWTIRTRDGRPSAHFEHTVLITEGKAEILTA